MKIARPFIRAVAVACTILSPLYPVSANNTLPASFNALPGLAHALGLKAASGMLIAQIERSLQASVSTAAKRPLPAMMTAIYAAEAPSPELCSNLAAKGGRAFPETWTPPSVRHPLGFFLAQIPIASMADVLSLDAVKKMDTAESESVPQSNNAARSIKADLAWSLGLTGTGVKIGILDSGLDVSFAGTELPPGLQKKDYSNYPQTDTVVANTFTGHGTHVTGCALARGMLSSLNHSNGGGAYKGMAPAADLAFLKIGLDGNGSATDAAEIAAIHAAVDTFHVKLLNLSYGWWDAYHDGSNIVSQTVDWAYSRGVSCFVAAGNYGNAARHASGSASPHDTSNFIQVDVGASSYVLQLAFNLVWSDGPARNNLSLLYYDSQKRLLADVTQYSASESARGTESRLSYSQSYMINQPGTYFLRVYNPSSATQVFHLYENYGKGFVQFTFPDPNSTLTTPGDADHAFTVGAYSSRETWTGADGFPYAFGPAANTLAPYSSRGPRVDGEMKPNITAPGSMLISLRDRDVLTSTTLYCVDDDGAMGGAADYYVMQGTSMASPVCAGAAALLYQQVPNATPQQIYDALMQKGASDAFTGSVPSPAWGFGKLNVYSALLELPLPVELVSLSSLVRNGSVILSWRTATETDNYGFSIERKAAEILPASVATPAAAWTTIGFVGGNGTTNAPHDYTFVDRPPFSGSAAYRLKQIDRDGSFAYSREIEVDAGAPATFSLAQNYPNPFNPSTTIPFAIAQKVHVRLAVCDLLGRTTSVLVDKVMDPGMYAAEWNAHGLASGVYICRLEAGAFAAAKKLVVQK